MDDCTKRLMRLNFEDFYALAAKHKVSKS